MHFLQHLCSSSSAFLTFYVLFVQYSVFLLLCIPPFYVRFLRLRSTPALDVLLSIVHAFPVLHSYLSPYIPRGSTCTVFSILHSSWSVFFTILHAYSILRSLSHSAFPSILHIFPIPHSTVHVFPILRSSIPFWISRYLYHSATLHLDTVTLQPAGSNSVIMIRLWCCDQATSGIWSEPCFFCPGRFCLGPIVTERSVPHQTWCLWQLDQPDERTPPPHRQLDVCLNPFPCGIGPFGPGSLCFNTTQRGSVLKIWKNYVIHRNCLSLIFIFRCFIKKCYFRHIKFI